MGGLVQKLTQRSSGGMMMTTEDSMQYDESYGAYEEGYDEGAYYQEGINRPLTVYMISLVRKPISKN